MPPEVQIRPKPVETASEPVLPELTPRTELVRRIRIPSSSADRTGLADVTSSTSLLQSRLSKKSLVLKEEVVGQLAVGQLVVGQQVDWVSEGRCCPASFRRVKVGQLVSSPENNGGSMKY